VKDDQRDMTSRAREKDRKKKPRLEKSVDDEEDDDLEFVVDKFDDEDDFIPFENENDETANTPHAGHSKHENFHTNHSIDDEFNSKDFFDDMNDERAFQALYS
jgi:hypothetical protein